MPHALLIHEAPGAGGEWLAYWAAQLVLCAHLERAPCGARVAYAPVRRSQHPDLALLGLQERATQIRIDQLAGGAGDPAGSAERWARRASAPPASACSSASRITVRPRRRSRRIWPGRSPATRLPIPCRPIRALPVALITPSDLPGSPGGEPARHCAIAADRPRPARSRRRNT